MGPEPGFLENDPGVRKMKRLVIISDTLEGQTALMSMYGWEGHLKSWIIGFGQSKPDPISSTDLPEIASLAQRHIIYSH